MKRPEVPTGDAADSHLQLEITDRDSKPLGNADPVHEALNGLAQLVPFDDLEVEGAGFPLRGELSSRQAELVEGATGLASGGIADSSKRAYEAAWARFESWCGVLEVVPPWFPVSVPLLLLYLAELESRGLALSTIRRELAGLRWQHELEELPFPTHQPTVKRALRELALRLGTEPERVKRAIMLPELVAMVAALDSSPRSIRDAAVLTLGWFTGLRRSELVALEWQDLAHIGGELVVRVRGGKTRQTGESHFVGLPLWTPDPIVCPVRSVALWRELGGGQAGPVFRPMDRWGNIRWIKRNRDGTTAISRLSGRDVVRILDRAARGAGLAARDQLGGHSLRRGPIVWLTSEGIAPERIQRVIGHRSVVTTLGYAAPHKALSDSPFRELARKYSARDLPD